MWHKNPKVFMLNFKGREMIFSKNHWPLSNTINLQISKQSIVYQMSNSCYVEVLHWKPLHLNIWKLYIKEIENQYFVYLDEVTVTKPLVYRFLKSLRSKLNKLLNLLVLVWQKGVTRSSTISKPMRMTS